MLTFLIGNAFRMERWLLRLDETQTKLTIFRTVKLGCNTRGFTKMKYQMLCYVDIIIHKVIRFHLY